VMFKCWKLLKLIMQNVNVKVLFGEKERSTESFWSLNLRGNVTIAPEWIKITKAFWSVSFVYYFKRTTLTNGRRIWGQN
jgi:hypothetical protein